MPFVELPFEGAVMVGCKSSLMWFPIKLMATEIEDIVFTHCFVDKDLQHLKLQCFIHARAFSYLIIDSMKSNEKISRIVSIVV